MIQFCPLLERPKQMMAIFSLKQKTPSAPLALIQFLLSPLTSPHSFVPTLVFPSLQHLQSSTSDYFLSLFFSSPSIAITAAAFVFPFSVLIILSLSIPVFPFCAPHYFGYVICMLALPSSLWLLLPSSLPQFMSNIDESSFPGTCY